jgi:hypothetical protein
MRGVCGEQGVAIIYVQVLHRAALRWRFQEFSVGFLNSKSRRAGGKPRPTGGGSPMEEGGLNGLRVRCPPAEAKGSPYQG